MSLRAQPAQLLSRRIALILALVCFWISGPVATHHTDDVSEFLTFHASRSAIGHATPPVAQIPCAACEWEQSLSDTLAPYVDVAWLPSVRVRYTVSLALALHLLSFDYTLLRGPPSTLS